MIRTSPAVDQAMDLAHARYQLPTRHWQLLRHAVTEALECAPLPRPSTEDLLDQAVAQLDAVADVQLEVRP